MNKVTLKPCPPVTQADVDAAIRYFNNEGSFQLSGHFAEVRQVAFLAGVKAMQEVAAKAMENLCFFTDVEELMNMTKQDLSVRTCHEGAQAIRSIDPSSIGEGG